MRELIESAFAGDPWSIGFLVLFVGLAIVGFVISNKQPQAKRLRTGNGNADLEARLRQIAEKHGYTLRSTAPESTAFAARMNQ